MKKRLLLVEDDVEISKIIRSYFENEGFEVFHTLQGKCGIDYFERYAPIDIVILDIMLPDLDGWSVCRKIRKLSDVPILILTARDDEDDELYGFELKANDYVKKPFSPRVLIARAKMLLETKDESTETISTINKGALTLNINSFEATIDGEYIELTKKEFQILQLLVANEKIILRREQILDNVWSFEYNTESRIVDNHIKNIRKALGDYAYYITTVFGVGYKFEVK